MKIKMIKHTDDPCFGEKYEQIEQCDYCWIKKACFATFRNRKK